jgi:hypothetical protein
MSQSLKLYCSECGQPNPYTIKKPNFCTFCGNGFTLEAKAKQVIRKQEEDDDDQDEVNEDGENSTPSSIDASSLDIEIEPQTRRRETIGQIASTMPDGAEAGYIRPVENINEKQLLKSFKTEAGTLRKK